MRNKDTAINKIKKTKFLSKAESGGQKGAIAILMSFFVLMIILLVSLVAAGAIVFEIKMSREIVNSVPAFYAADAGAEKCLYEIRKDTVGCAIEGGSTSITLDNGATVTATRLSSNSIQSGGNFTQTNRRVEISWAGSITPPSTPACSDGIDNDGDSLTDWPADPGCTDASDDDETDPPPLPQCSDGVDNADPEDTIADFPADPGCANANDNDETDPVPTFFARAGTFTANAGTGNQSVSGLGFQPKVVLFWITDRTSAGNGANARFGRGWTDCTNEGAISTAWSDASAASSVATRPSNTKIVNLINNSGTVLAEADIVSCNSDGFTVSWSTAGGSRIVGYLALGGASLTNVRAGSKTDVNPPIGSSISVTGVGFRPDAVFMLGHEAGDFNVSNTRGQGTFGVGVSATNRQAAGWRQRYQVSCASNCGSSGLSTQGIFIPADDSSTPEFSVDLVSMNADGFTYIYDVGSSDRNVPILYLALKGINIARGVLTQRTSTGSQSVIGLSFQPKAVLFDSGDKAATDGFEQNAEYLTGAATDSASRFGIWIGNGDPTGGTSISDTSLSTTAVIRSLTAGTPTVNASADFVSMNSDGFTINWTTVDSTQRKIGWIAF